MNDTKHIKWHLRPSVVIIALLAAGPFALPLVWMSPAFTKPVKNDARVGRGKMFEGDVQRVFRRRREFDLKAGMKTALPIARFFKAKIFLENPKQVDREIAFDQQLFPCVERFFQ